MSTVLDRPVDLVAENQAIVKEAARRRVRVDAAGRFLWTRAAFLEALYRGDFDTDNKIELLHGEVYFKMTMQIPHFRALYNVLHALQPVFEPGRFVIMQMPMALNEEDYPEPDLAVVEENPAQMKELPETALLVVEVSDTTLNKDRTTKAAIYAEAGIADYWILNLIDRVLECYRQPAPMPSEPLGFGYRSITRFSEVDSLAPLSAPQNPIAVAALLP